MYTGLRYLSFISVARAFIQHLSSPAGALTKISEKLGIRKCPQSETREALKPKSKTRRQMASAPQPQHSKIATGRRHQNISAATTFQGASSERIRLDRHQYHLKMSLFLNRGGDHEQEQTQKQKEGFLSRVLKHRKDKRTQEGEEDRRPSPRTRYRQKQSENLWGDARRSSCSSRVMRDIKRIHRRLSGS